MRSNPREMGVSSSYSGGVRNHPSSSYRGSTVVLNLSVVKAFSL